LSLLINRSKKWGYLHIPKTGGSSISSVLHNVEGTKDIVVHDSIRAFNNVNDYFIFTIVRNPFTRIASAYEHEKRKGRHDYNFYNFLKNSSGNELILLPQSYYINAGQTKDKKVSFVGRYETYEKDVSYIFNKIGVTTPIPHLNRNPLYEKQPNLNQEKYYKYFYSEEWMKDWVRERYENDFKIFNYDMDI